MVNKGCLVTQINQVKKIISVVACFLAQVCVLLEIYITNIDISHKLGKFILSLGS